jgi:alpha-ketoglutarate-dependent taurine dioxygenase
MNLQALEDRPFGAVIGDLDCAAVTAEQTAEIRRALHEYQLLVIPDQQHLTPKQEVAFYKSIDTQGETVWRDQVNNPWEIFKVKQGNLAGTYQIPDEPGVLVLGKGEIDHYGLKVTLGGNRAAYGESEGSQVLGGGALQWHIDGAFYDVDPCLYTQMRCIEAPGGEGHWLHYGDGSDDKLWCAAGSTAFASGRLAFQLLDTESREFSLNTDVHYLGNPFQATYHLANTDNGLRAIDPVAEQQYATGEDEVAEPVDDRRAKIYPLVWTCPVTGEKSLMPHPRCMHYLETDYSGVRKRHGVTGSRHKVEQLMRPAINSERVYVHAWRAGDLVIWNNRSVWHSATGELARDDRRIQHLTAFNSSVPPG